MDVRVVINPAVMPRAIHSMTPITDSTGRRRDDAYGSQSCWEMAKGIVTLPRIHRSFGPAASSPALLRQTKNSGALPCSHECVAGAAAGVRSNVVILLHLLIARYRRTSGRLATFGGGLSLPGCRPRQRRPMKDAALRTTTCKRFAVRDQVSRDTYGLDRVISVEVDTVLVVHRGHHPPQRTGGRLRASRRTRAARLADRWGTQDHSPRNP